MKDSYKFLEHSADIKVIATAKDFPSALKQVFYALREFLISKKNPKISKKKNFVLKEKGETTEELVFNFFSSLLAEYEIRQMIPVEINILKYRAKPPKLQAKIYLSDEIKQKDQIKAVTYHELKVKQTPKKTMITIIFDV
ncbi:MAG: archease [Candidatus Anstonellaceae archaeon]